MPRKNATLSVKIFLQARIGALTVTVPPSIRLVLSPAALRFQPHEIPRKQPARDGKEKRKPAPSKEGLLGVEGMDATTVIAALERAGATFEDAEAPTHQSLNLTKADWMALGLSGTADSQSRRNRLAEALGVPTYLSANRLLELVNTTVTAEEWEQLRSVCDEPI